MPVIGIDLGTTNSLVAYFTPEGAKIIPNSFGEHLTPSVVSVDADGMVYVGKIAKEMQLTAPENTVATFKRYMGSPKQFELGNRTFTPVELSSLVIKKLREDAENHLGCAIEEAVISTPAYFNDAQRRAVKTAGELAGLKVERIISEPTAAAVAYGLHSVQMRTKAIVFDLGGGTFDVSVLEYIDGVMEVHAVAGDNFLGGEDFTDVLAQMLLQEHNIDPNTLTPRERASLYKSAESAKLQFHNADRVSIKWVKDGKPLTLSVNNEQYEQACVSLFVRLNAPIVRAVSDAALKLTDLDALVLVGGATRLPLIKQFVGRLFSKLPTYDINPDEAVALGAAVQAAMKERNEAIRELILTDVCPYTLGTDVAVKQDNGLVRSGIFAPIIERNTVIPTSRSERFFTLYDNQESVNVEILQGESHRTQDNISLGELAVPVPPGKAGSQSIDVRYTYDVNGILEVEVKVISTGQIKRMVIEKNPGEYTPEQIQERLQALSALKLHPREKDENRYLLERGERYYQYSKGSARRKLGDVLNDFESALDGQDPKIISQKRQNLQAQLDLMESDADG
jgi:molecular chaperone HscC